MLVRAGFGSLPNQFGSHRTALVSQALYCTAPLGLSYWGAAALLPVGILHGLSHGALFPALSAMASSATMVLGIVAPS